MNWNWWIFAVSFLYVCLGYMLGTFVGQRRGPGNQPEEEISTAADASFEVPSEEAREFLQRLQELAGAVDHDVDRHSSRIAKISGQLRGDSRHDAAVVLAAATQLVEANKQLQADLASARQEIRLQQQQLDSYMTEARTDALTGLANRRAFDQELVRRFAQWQRQRIPLSLVLLDVDDFKRFNDRHGHQAGDDVLRGVARVLSDAVREMDLVARYGGEEFAIILPGTELDDAKPTAERLRTAIAGHSFPVGDAEFRITVSAGLAAAMAGDEANLLVKHADAGLYSAKAAGRNRSYFYNGTTCEPIGETEGGPSYLVPGGVYRIASYVDGRFPERETFRRVTCQELSPTGFSYLLPEPPDYDLLVLASGTGPETSYMTASVEESSNIGSEAEPLFRVACRFTSRVESAPAPQVSAAGHRSSNEPGA